MCSQRKKEGDSNRERDADVSLSHPQIPLRISLNPCSSSLTHPQLTTVNPDTPTPYIISQLRSNFPKSVNRSSTQTHHQALDFAAETATNQIGNAPAAAAAAAAAAHIDIANGFRFPLSLRRLLHPGAPLPPRLSCATAERPRSMAAGARSQASSLYEVLGIRAGATGQEIKTAYRRLARVLHPDVAAPAGAGAAAAGREFMRVHEAYATLSDPDRRADYDRTLFRGPGRFSVPVATAAAAAAASARGPSRKWETDQCW